MVLENRHLLQLLLLHHNPSFTKPFATHTFTIDDWGRGGGGGGGRPDCCLHEGKICRVLKTLLNVLEMISCLHGGNLVTIATP